MKLIRNGVFETNSSSCHTISVATGSTNFESIPTYFIENNVATIPAYEFGWSEEQHDDIVSRLSYILLYIRDWSGDKESKFNSILQDIVTDQCQVDSIRLDSGKANSWGGYDNGYIDHQAVEGGALNYLFDDPSTLKQFIFASGSYVETGNDNG